MKHCGPRGVARSDLVRNVSGMEPGHPKNWPAPVGIHPNRGCHCHPNDEDLSSGTPTSGKRTRKPNSVLCSHSSRRRVTAGTHQRPTRRFRSCMSQLAASGRCRAAARPRLAASLPIWSCSVWGLPCLRHYCRSGALLPHLFTLTRRGERYIFCGTGRPRALKPASRTLSGTLPCGVRTFLSRSFRKPRQRPPGPPAVFQFIAKVTSKECR